MLKVLLMLIYTFLCQQVRRKKLLQAERLYPHIHNALLFKQNPSLDHTSAFQDTVLSMFLWGVCCRQKLFSRNRALNQKRSFARICHMSKSRFLLKNEIPFWKRIVVRLDGSAFAFMEGDLEYRYCHCSKHGYYVASCQGYLREVHCRLCQAHFASVLAGMESPSIPEL